MRFERLSSACGINVYRKRFSCLKTAKTYARIKSPPAFHNAGGRHNKQLNLHTMKKSTLKNTLQRYCKFLIYANFARKIWKYEIKAVILRRQN